MLGFVVGFITGGFAAYYYRDEISRYLNRQGPALREQLANTLHSVEEGVSDALGRARTNLSDKLRHGEDRLRTGGQRSANGRAASTPAS
jgi:hypothetical protein